MCLCFASDTLLLCGSHIFITELLSGVSSLSVISSFHIPVIPHGPLLPPHPTSEPNHSHHCNVMNNLEHILILEVTRNCENKILDWSAVTEWLTVAHVEL